jgi:hypothetical protein
MMSSELVNFQRIKDIPMKRVLARYVLNCDRLVGKCEDSARCQCTPRERVAIAFR